MTLPVELALEWFRASGERSEERLLRLVDHFAFTNAYQGDEMIAALHDEAKRKARDLIT